MSSVVLTSDLLYQSAAIVFLDGGRVSEGLVKGSYQWLVWPSICLSSAQLSSFCFCGLTSSQEILDSFQGKCGRHT